MTHGRHISVIGLGYVGLPVAVSFALAGDSVVAFDIDATRIEELANDHDRTNEIPPAELQRARLTLSSEPDSLRRADFHIVTVPTPIDKAKRPDLTPLLAATRTVGGVLKRGDIVVYESTVFPGATEEECVPLLEAISGLRVGEDFAVGYSPERINPGDHEHRFESITKVVSASDEATLDIIANVYGSVVQAGIHRAPTIRTAEAAKVIENTQRDLNIALMNELAMIFCELGIDTREVLEAAATKWNFLPFMPGLVGGHCIGVDPFYLTHRAERAGYHPEIILAGRRINDGMSKYIAMQVAKGLMRNGCLSRAPRVTVLGVTFKENVPDVRNSKVVDMIAELQDYAIAVQVVDPVADAAYVLRETGLAIVDKNTLAPSGAVILSVPHATFLDGGWPLITSLLADGTGLVFDIKSVLDRARVPDGVELLRL